MRYFADGFTCIRHDHFDYLKLAVKFGKAIEYKVSQQAGDLKWLAVHGSSMAQSQANLTR